MKNVRLFSLLCLVILGCTQSTSKTFLFVGSYTDGEPRDGIYVFELNLENGQLKEVEREGQLVNSSFLALSSDGEFLYACTETRMDVLGNVSSFKVDKGSGQIDFINKQTTGNRNPVHLMLDRADNFVFASNYTDASISVFQRNTDGSLNPYSQLLKFDGHSIIKGRQDEAHIHSSFISPDNKYLIAPDLGSDLLRIFCFDKENLLTEKVSLNVATNKGAGPRHFIFHHKLPYAYSIEELSGQIAFYEHKNGQFNLYETYSSYEKNQDIYSSADIHISPDGRFLYTSNRYDENSIAAFKIDQSNGKLSLISHTSVYGKKPRSFVIDPSGNFLIVANQDSDNLVVLQRNMNTGKLTKVSEISGITSPSSLKMFQY